MNYLQIQFNESKRPFEIRQQLVTNCSTKQRYNRNITNIDKMCTV